jgi:hypothetical protein
LFGGSGHVEDDNDDEEDEDSDDDNFDEESEEDEDEDEDEDESERDEDDGNGWNTEAYGQYGLPKSYYSYSVCLEKRRKTLHPRAVSMPITGPLSSTTNGFPCRK